MAQRRQITSLTVHVSCGPLSACVCLAVSKALEQLDAASRDAAAAKQRAEQLEQELTRTQQQAQSAQTQVDRWAHSVLYCHKCPEPAYELM